MISAYCRSTMRPAIQTGEELKLLDEEWLGEYQFSKQCTRGYEVH